jgi:hypothetical protein
MLKRLFICILICGFTAIVIATCCPKASQSLVVTLHPQETSMWCWAASGQMVMDYLGHNVSQCVQANNRFGRNDCCTIDLCPPPTETACPTPGWHPCACGGWPEFGKYNFSFNRTTSAALSWEDLKKQISSGSNCEEKPFCFTWKWNGGGGHVMVAIGYTTIDGVNFVEINDPWSPCVGDHRFITYNAYVSGPTYTHWDDFYDITYQGGE